MPQPQIGTQAVVGVPQRPPLEDLLPGAVKSGAGELTKASAAGYTMLLYALKPFDGRASTTGEAAVLARLAGFVSIEHMPKRAYVAPGSVSKDHRFGNLQKGRECVERRSLTHL